MKRILIAMVVGLVAVAGQAADVTLARDCPTNNVDGSALVDISSYEIEIVSGGTTNVFTFPALVAAPVGLVSQTNTLTGIASRTWTSVIRTVAGDAESTNSASITFRAGKPGNPKNTRKQ